MLLNMSLDFLMLGTAIWVFTYFYDFRIMTITNPILYWVAMLVVEDFLFYLLHYVDHYVRFFWAIHVTHHSSEEFNFTVGFRSSVLQPLYRFIYFIPLPLLGFQPLDIAFMYSATQIYGILIHTQLVGKLGFLEWFMVTPSHHRVHHGSNPEYLDKNIGMIFIFWDKLFGTFQREMETVKLCYGLTTKLKNENPANVIFHEWREIGKDLRKPVSFRTKLKYLFGPPGWSHDGMRKTSRELLADLRKAEDSRKMWVMWHSARPYWHNNSIKKGA
jgi:sterol desaturase/sphingolipid hydroxylase (fatty acid hydroxylase superfamily)